MPKLRWGWQVTLPAPLPKPRIPCPGLLQRQSTAGRAEQLAATYSACIALTLVWLLLSPAKAAPHFSSRAACHKVLALGSNAVCLPRNWPVLLNTLPWKLGAQCYVQAPTAVRGIFHSANRSPPLCRGGPCAGLKENVAALPPITGIHCVRVPAVDHSIVNVEGKKASVAIYAYLAAQHGGRLDRAAAERGIELYGEYVEEARQHPGSHPNIDLLLRVAAEGLSLDILVEEEAQ